MSVFLSCFFAIALFLSPVLTPAAIAVPDSLPMAALPGFSSLFAGEAPELGIKDGQLSACPKSPNCVVSQDADEEHRIEPITYTGDRDRARDLLAKVLGVVPRTEIVEQTDNYIRVESSSRLMGFVDDAEFYLPEDESVIHLRSAARLGESDLGVNRRRLEQIRFAMRDLGA